MNRKRIIFILVICTGLKANAQFDTSFIHYNLKRCADSLTSAFKASDWEKFTRYSYPALVGSLGGKKEFTDYIAKTFGQIPASAWKEYETGKILQVVKTGGDFQAVIELKSKIEFDNFRTTSVTTLIGESWDGGMFWTFFDSQGDKLATKIIKPDLDPSIVIPPREEKNEAMKK